jgi:hypothetical protein
VAVADDAWQYCDKHIKGLEADVDSPAMAEKSRKLRIRIETMLRQKPAPIGLNGPEQDQFPRPASLPNKRVDHW